MQEPEVVVCAASLIHNLRLVQRSQPGVALFPVLKANAYGHGAELVASLFEKHFSDAELPYFCVARLSEARELRRQKIGRPLLLLSHFSREDFEKGSAVDNLEVVLSSPGDVEDLLQIPAARRNSLAGVHLNLNTGMNRLGFEVDATNPVQAAKNLGIAAARLKQAGIATTGLMTHLASSEDLESGVSLKQVALFEKITHGLRGLWNNSAHGTFPRWIHVSNSAGLVRGLANNSVNAARPGLHLWGLAPAAPALVEGLRPALTVRAPLRQLFRVKKGEGVGYGHRFIALRDTWVGTLSLGYADGVDRRLSRAAGEKWQLGFVIEGVRVPIVGTVSMDMTMVDLTDHPLAEKWQEPGEQKSETTWAYWIDGTQSVDEVARVLGTINYEIISSLGHRLLRRLEETQP